jgi:hypothetical protein
MASVIQNARGMQDAAGNVAQKAHDTAATVGDKAKELAATVGDRAKDFAASAADQAKQVGKSATNMADNATARVGSGVESLAGKLRDSAPQEGIIHNAASRVANTLERGGHYLKEEGLTGMADDLTGVIKRNPIPAVLVGIGIGYLIAHALRR